MWKGRLFGLQVKKAMVVEFTPLELQYWLLMDPSKNTRPHTECKVQLIAERQTSKPVVFTFHGLSSLVQIGTSTLNVQQLSPDYKSKKGEDMSLKKNFKYILVTKLFCPAMATEIKSNEAMTIYSLNAKIEGYSLLDVGHAQIQSLQLNIADSSAIILSGGALKKMGKLYLPSRVKAVD
jgi:hypothetical protein